VQTEKEEEWFQKNSSPLVPSYGEGGEEELVKVKLFFPTFFFPCSSSLALLPLGPQGERKQPKGKGVLRKRKSDNPLDR